MLDFIFAGDLLNQCISAGYAARGTGIPFFGLYGACSTMAESLGLAALLLDGEFGEWGAAVTSSHFCSRSANTAHRWNTAGSAPHFSMDRHSGWRGSAGQKQGRALYHPRHPGRIQDKGIKDANNMGAAMAWAAYDTISQHLKDTPALHRLLRLDRNR